ncbi:OLC1v1004766C8 [Oldenlandia corymbosa var. corymbosa]|uniref:OLC1v1004766C8 n=1 Tax=Oldenlandia corymbosa var. corymbosa TaxID=529605 RepID=A0AAV1DDQ5_OLDCO|nr:OLC1v1004766C8 [Oldenlandia corymbosa var. corymbosa]
MSLALINNNPHPRETFCITRTFRAKEDHLAFKFSFGELFKDKILNGTGLHIEFQSRLETSKSMEADDKELAKPPS